MDGREVLIELVICVCYIEINACLSTTLIYLIVARIHEWHIHRVLVRPVKHLSFLNERQTGFGSGLKIQDMA